MLVRVLLIQTFHICINGRGKGAYCVRNTGREWADKVAQAKERTTVPFGCLLAEQRENNGLIGPFLNHQIISVRICLAELEDRFYFIILVKRIQHPVGLFKQLHSLRSFAAVFFRGSGQP